MAEAANPAGEILTQLLGHFLHFHASRPTRQLPSPLLEPKNRLRRDPPFWFPIRREAKAQKLLFPWPHPGTPLRLASNQAVKGIFTPELSNMPGTPKKGLRAEARSPEEEDKQPVRG